MLDYIELSNLWMLQMEMEDCDLKDSMERLLTEFSAYQKKKEKGLILELPCALGTTMYRIFKCPGKGIKKDAYSVRPVTFNGNNLWRIVFGGDFGRTVFLTHEEAVKRMKEEQIISEEDKT